MAEETVSKRGRPVGTRTATVELETLSFKVPAEFKTQLQAYAKQRRHSISELIREGVEWRIGEGDPLNIRYGTAASGETAYGGNTGNTQGVEVGVEFLHGMLSALVDEVRQLRNAVQALEQRLEDTRSVQAPSVPPVAMAPKVKVDKEEVIGRIQQMRDKGLDSAQIAETLQAEGVPTLSAEAQLQAVVEMLELRAAQDSSEGDTGTTSVDGDMPVASMEAQSAFIQPLAVEDTRESIPPYDPAKRVLGKLCPRGHDYHGTGQSLRKNNRSRTCCACDVEQKRERRQAKRQEVSA